MVKKGDLMVKFEHSKLIEEFETRQIEIAKDNAGIESAKQALIQIHQDNDPTMQTLELNLKLAELNRKKSETEFNLKLRKAENELTLSKKQLDVAELNFTGYQNRIKVGRGSKGDLRAAEIKFEEAKSKLEIAIGEKENLVKHVHAYETTVHQIAIQQAESALRKAKALIQNKAAAAKATLNSLQVISKIKAKGLNRLEEQIQKSEIYALSDGLIIYPNKRASRLKKRLPEIWPHAGAVFRKKQLLIILQDLSQFQISIKIHPSHFGEIVIGQLAKIRIDALPGRLLDGKVTQISNQPEVHRLFGSSPTVYRIKVEIENPPDGLRPGLTATVELLPGK